MRYYHNHSLDGATLFSKLDSNKLRFNVKNEMTLIFAKFDADLINISKVRSRKTKWPSFLAYPVVNLLAIVTPRSRAVLTADDNTGTCRMSNVDPLYLELGHHPQ